MAAAPALLTDLYQLTMAEAYLASGAAGRRAVFELFFRRAPHGGAYAVAAGTEAALEFIEGFRFAADEIDYLRSRGTASPALLERIRSLRFGGDVDAMPEGTVVFPREPLLRVEADIVEGQVLETALLNLVGFATLVATKAARVAQAAGPAEVVEFGARRAQGPDGALTAARSAYLGGAAATSLLLAGKRFGIPVKGTMAHSFVMAFPTELEAFRAYARTFPDDAILLLDTYHTLESGLPSAIRVARELEAGGHRLRGVRLDSGDLAVLSRRVRAALDEAGLGSVRILASGDLEERRIAELRAAGAPIDSYGVGTQLAASAGDPALTSVYKLVAVDPDGKGTIEGRLKETDDPAKGTLPGAKQVHRRLDRGGRPRRDLLALREEPPPALPAGESWEALLEPAIRGGRRVRRPEDLSAARARALRSVAALPEEHRRLDGALPYPVELSPGLESLRARLLGAR